MVGRRVLRSAELRFALAGLVTVAAIGTFTMVAVSQISSAEALRSARERAELAGRGIVEPLLDGSLLEPGSPTAGNTALQTLDEIVQARVLSERVLRVKIWTADGRIVYSDRSELVGERFAPKGDHVVALSTGSTASEVASTRGPENRFERDSGRLLEVYLPVRTIGGTPLVYEQYERYDSVAASARRLLNRLALPLGAGLLLLWLTQIPLARSLARRVRAAEAERAAMYELAMTASERERERIAADLHDGVVQDMAGLAYDLAASTHTAPEGPLRESLAHSTDTARNAMKRLRTSLVDLSPVNAGAMGLATALDGLLEPLRRAGHSVTLHADLGTAVPDDVASLAYRVCQELVRNVAEHASARNVLVTARLGDGTLVLVVADDGVGFSPRKRDERRRDGHIGLDLQHALVRRAGGTLRIDSRDGQGTVATMTAPLADRERTTP